MTTSVVTVTPETSVEEIARLLVANHVSAVPVVDRDGRLRGIVSEGDLMRRPETGTERQRSWWLTLFGAAENLTREYVKSHGRHAGDVMTAPVVTVTEATPVAEIARLLEERRIKRVPVVRDSRLVGIVSRADLIRALASRPRPEPRPPADDATIRTRVLEALEAAGLVPGVSVHVNVVVSEGVVHLWGLVETEDQRQACRVAAEGVPGVRSVQDHLSRLPPYLRS